MRVEPGQKFDAETDRILFFGGAGKMQNVITGLFSPFLMNGKEQPEAMTLKAATRYRFRLFNLANDLPLLPPPRGAPPPPPFYPPATITVPVHVR